MATKQPWMHKSPLFGVSVPGHGPKPAMYMLIGERPGKTDPATGRPFTGAAGHELDRYLRMAQIDRADCYVTNLVKDYRDDDPTPEEVERDLPLLLEEIEECSPMVLCLLGRFAIRHFLGDVDVEQVHGIAFEGEVYGFPGVTLYPCFHPAAGLHNGDIIPFIASDFRGLGDLPSRQLPSDQHRRPEYRAQTGKDWLDPQLPVAIDSEGIGFTGPAYSLQWTQRVGVGLMAYAGAGASTFSRDFNRFWSAGGRVWLHGSLHDLKELRKLGVHVRGGQFTDTMVLAYLLCDLPQGLKPLAYRLAGMEMQDYAEVVAPAREYLHAEWLAGALAVADDIPLPDLELVWDDPKALWRTKQPQAIATRLRRIESDLSKWAEGGKPVDIAKRVSDWGDSAAAELEAICGKVPEPSLADIPRAAAERYACRDADATLRIAPILWQRVVEQQMEEVCAIDHSIIPMVDMMQEHGILINPDHFRDMDARLTLQMDLRRDEIADMVGVRINPSSSPQVAALLFKQLGLPSRKLTRGGDESTQDKVLEGLRSSHPVLPLILDYRELDKMRGSFCRKMPKLAGADNRVRGNIRVTRTASGRLAMNTPNLMAIPVRSALGRELRKGFIARPGCKIGSWDLDQIEMRVIADESGDVLLHELFSDAGRDVHAETAARMFDKPVDRVDPKTERYAAKRVGFGIATQITGRGLVDQMELAGATHSNGDKWTEAECDSLIDLWFGVYPGVRRFIDRTKAEVRRFGEVRDRWGRLRLLPGVYSTVERIREESLRQGPSHKIQAGAQGLMKKAMARLWALLIEHNLLDDVWPLLQIHDSIMLEYPEELEPFVDSLVMEALQETIKLSVPVTASGESGLTWGDMVDITG